MVVFLRSVHRLLVAACVVPSSPIFVTLMKEAPGYATRRNNPEDTILHVYHRFRMILHRAGYPNSCPQFFISKTNSL
jgi:hypothetical protein